MNWLTTIGLVNRSSGERGSQQANEEEVKRRWMKELQWRATMGSRSQRPYARRMLDALVSVGKVPRVLKEGFQVTISSKIDTALTNLNLIWQDVNNILVQTDINTKNSIESTCITKWITSNYLSIITTPKRGFDKGTAFSNLKDSLWKYISSFNITIRLGNNRIRSNYFNVTFDVSGPVSLFTRTLSVYVDPYQPQSGRSVTQCPSNCPRYPWTNSYGVVLCAGCSNPVPPQQVWISTPEVVGSSQTTNTINIGSTSLITNIKCSVGSGLTLVINALGTDPGGLIIKRQVASSTTSSEEWQIWSTDELYESLCRMYAFLLVAIFKNINNYHTGLTSLVQYNVPTITNISQYTTEYNNTVSALTGPITSITTLETQITTHLANLRLLYPAIAKHALDYYSAFFNDYDLLTDSLKTSLAFDLSKRDDDFLELSSFDANINTDATLFSNIFSIETIIKRYDLKKLRDTTAIIKIQKPLLDKLAEFRTFLASTTACQTNPSATATIKAAIDGSAPATGNDVGTSADGKAINAITSTTDAQIATLTKKYDDAISALKTNIATYIGSASTAAGTYNTNRPTYGFASLTKPVPAAVSTTTKTADATTACTNAQDIQTEINDNYESRLSKAQSALTTNSIPIPASFNDANATASKKLDDMKNAVEAKTKELTDKKASVSALLTKLKTRTTKS